MPPDHHETFQTTVLDPEAWKSSARALIDASAALEPKIDEFWQAVKTTSSWPDGAVAVYFMLCSFALENLLKSRIVERRRFEFADSLRSTSKLPEELKGHDLYKLMCAADLKDLAAEEESLLRRLTRSAEWYGRYPVPVSAPKLDPFQKSKHDDFQISLTQYSSDDRNDIKRLLRELGR
jgi:hypothetical protein